MAKKKEEFKLPPGTPAPWMSTFSDMMTLLMCFFVLLFSMSTVDAQKFEEANVDENVYLELDELLQDDDLFNQFAVMYTEEKDKKAAAKDKEQEKEEQIAVQDKNGAGV